jgi:signal transduction histidine kinase
MSERERTYLQTPEQWTRFLTAFVQELRTPLASFRMLADLLAEASRNHLGEQEWRYSENLREVVQDIQSLVGDVGELSRLLSGRVQVRPEEVGLEKLVCEVEELMRLRAGEGGIALTGSLETALPGVFRADRDRLRQILILLLSAAVSHAKSEVFFRLDNRGQGFRAFISSDGAPFPEPPAQAVFEPFHDGFRALRQRGGHSLALPLADELAQVLGGTLRAENRGGRPAFDLSIPSAA